MNRFHPVFYSWDVDGKELVTKLRSLDHLAMFALVDAVERFWAHPTEATDPSGAIALDFSKVFADPVAKPTHMTGGSARQLSDILNKFSGDEDSS